MGPKSRAAIQAVTKTDMSNAAFKFGEVREIGSRAMGAGVRVTYGQLGWELHMPLPPRASVRCADGWASCTALRLGYRALESPGWRRAGPGVQTSRLMTPLHAGLGWAVKMKSNRRFWGAGN
jgi:4-methylaminobutanoate oxidase (formaldehyde-forming)